MCPIWPLHLIILYLLALCPLWVICQAAPNLVATYFPNNITVHMGEYQMVDVSIHGTGMQVDDKLLLNIEDRVAMAEWNSTYKLTEDDVNAQEWKGKVRVDAVFLGRAALTVEVERESDVTGNVNGTLPVIIVRPERVIDTVFTTSIAVFISLIFINFGCAMDWPTVKECVKRPIGPLIGLCGQFVFMPLLSFGLGFLIFPNQPEMRLGMFFTGCAPGGGASNIWTFILGGNLNLSLAMSAISTLAAFGFIPLWLFSLGQVVFRNANIVVPYKNISFFVVGLIVPLCIGLAMQRYTPRISAFMVRILKVFSTTLLIFIIVFAIVTNLYIFQLFTWEIIVAGMGLPWIGYLTGYVVARAFRQPHEDALAISIETGIQNTGIAIFLLRYALDPPEMDLTTVVPVSCAIMTPIPMTCIFIYQKVKGCIANRNQHKKMAEDLTPIPEARESDLIATIDVGK